MSNPSSQAELIPLFEALCNETITAEQHSQLQQLLKSNAAAQQFYLDYIDLHFGLRKLAQEEFAHEHPDVDPIADSVHGQSATGSHSPRHLQTTRSAHPVSRKSRDVISLSRQTVAVVSAVAAILTIALTLAVMRNWQHGAHDGPVNVAVENEPEVTADAGQTARLVQSAGAKFFGESSPPVGGALSLQHEYALTDGMVELGFPDGASAIIEAPAVFQIATLSSLKLRVGRCSVHAPDGAEGFRVETPLTNVVDLGTRFSVRVDETGETDVQVVEGEAEIYAAASDPSPSSRVRLTSQQANRYVVAEQVASKSIPYDASAYRRRLPDRVISYRAVQRNEGVEDLIDLTVQRGGNVYSYRAEDLIGIDLIHFRAADSNRSNVTTRTGIVDPRHAAPGDRRRTDLLDRDRNLNTGVINPGGSREPLTADPLIPAAANPDVLGTPGFAVRFQQPVVNSAGPDVVLFELQLIVHPESGDPFHVSPLRFGDNLRSHTIRSYDIDLSSPDAQMLAGFRLYKFDDSIRSLDRLLQATHNGGSEHLVRAKAIVASIDLSDLGYAPGTAVEGLFFQDALDDENLLDPVFIAGLPALDDVEVRN